MIDPKLNELPVDPNDEIALSGARTPEGSGAEQGPRRGLSINDTVASNANLSTGARGVDTSGVRAGAGAGAGSTMVTPGEAGESVSPQIVGGDRGSGTTVLGANDSTAVGSTVPDSVEGTQGLSGHDTDRISARAYQLWCDRGCPEGSPEVDWHRALDEHRQSNPTMTRTAGA